MVDERSSMRAGSIASGEPVTAADPVRRTAMSLAILGVIGAVLIMAWGSQRLAAALKPRDTLAVCGASVSRP
ncbi:hypothetical protein BWR60_02095 [Inquilinus limosus]|uniref:Uncharacterized protein n=1 Tax=Inquilinus limosus TaxID=171674 RepID=A0A211ZUE0_9PROT|nr:hypothetical protein BWR60_02095 [Inquilinus limosus]